MFRSDLQMHSGRYGTTRFARGPISRRLTPTLSRQPLGSSAGGPAPESRPKPVPTPPLALLAARSGGSGSSSRAPSATTSSAAPSPPACARSSPTCGWSYSHEHSTIQTGTRRLVFGTGLRTSPNTTDRGSAGATPQPRLPHRRMDQCGFATIMILGVDSLTSTAITLAKTKSRQSWIVQWKTVPEREA